MNHRLDTDEVVYCYMDEFYPLSNFAAFRLYWQGFDFDTSEHAYQASKFINCPILGAHETSLIVARQRSAHDAFKVAQVYASLRFVDWDQRKVGVMREILAEKVRQHSYVRKKLLDTGDRRIVEDSWRDGWWGTGPNGDGKNMLGVLWMEVRDSLRREIEAKEVDRWQELTR